MDNIIISDGFLFIDCRNYVDDLLLLNDLKRTLADHMDGELKGIFVDLRNQFNVCSSIIGNIAKFYKEHKVVALLVDISSSVNDMVCILGFDKLAKIFYDENEYNNFTTIITNKKHEEK